MSTTMVFVQTARLNSDTAVNAGPATTYSEQYIFDLTDEDMAELMVNHGVNRSGWRPHMRQNGLGRLRSVTNATTTKAYRTKLAAIRSPSAEAAPVSPALNTSPLAETGSPMQLDITCANASYSQPTMHGPDQERDSETVQAADAVRDMGDSRPSQLESQAPRSSRQVPSTSAPSGRATTAPVRPGLSQSIYASNGPSPNSKRPTNVKTEQSFDLQDISVALATAAGGRPSLSMMQNLQGLQRQMLSQVDRQLLLTTKLVIDQRQTMTSTEAAESGKSQEDAQDTLEDVLDEVQNIRRLVAETNRIMMEFVRRFARANLTQ